MPHVKVCSEHIPTPDILPLSKMKQRNMLQRRRHRNHLPSTVRLICPPIRPLPGPIGSTTSIRLREINLPLRNIRQRHRCHQQSRSKHVFLRCHVRIQGCPVRDIGIHEAEIHVQGPHDHSAREVELGENCFEVRSELVAEVNVRGDDRGVLGTVGPGFVVAGVSVLEVAGAGAMLR